MTTDEVMPELKAMSVAAHNLYQKLWKEMETDPQKFILDGDGGKSWYNMLGNIMDNCRDIQEKCQEIKILHDELDKLKVILIRKGEESQSKL